MKSYEEDIIVDVTVQMMSYFDIVETYIDAHSDNEVVCNLGVLIEDMKNTFLKQANIIDPMKTLLNKK